METTTETKPSFDLIAASQPDLIVPEGVSPDFHDMLRLDRDGLFIPGQWQFKPDRWEAQPYGWRKRFSDDWIAELIQASKPKKEKISRPAASKFSTDYAIRYGRKQGWKLIDRENYNHLTKRHHDLEGGVDAMFDDLTTARVGIQGAGKSERKIHFDRFLTWGGKEKATRRNLRVLYLEFERGNYEPFLLEWWA